MLAVRFADHDIVSQSTARLHPVTAQTVTLDDAKQLARRALDNGKLADACSIANKILSAAPLDPVALLLVAEADMACGRFAIGRSLVNRALALAPNYQPALHFARRLDELDARAAADEYRSAWLALRSRYMDYPMNIQLETVGRCNAKCVFCPHEQLERKNQVMSDTLFKKIIHDASAIPSDIPVNFFLNVVNEPFMDKKIFERIAFVNRSMSHATIGIYTNMGVMPPGFLEHMQHVHRLTAFNVSFNAAKKNEYEAVMGIDFERTVSNIRRLLTENRTRHYFNFPVTLSRVSSMDERDSRFEDECKNVFAGFEYGREFVAVCRRRANWLQQSAHTSVPYLEPCNQWFNISVLCTGIVPHCCMDATGRFALGDANGESILDIYNSPRFRTYRDSVPARETVYPCNTCALA
jgi:tetratricopeptide (TPR) repeat protein